MSEVQITVKDSGPYVISGPLTLVDGAGDPVVAPGEVIALCRCGHSAKKPFCDGSHKAAGFDSQVRAG